MLTITTTNNLDGYEVVEYLGIVTGEAVSGINMFRDIGPGLRNVFGGRSADMKMKWPRRAMRLCVRSRSAPRNLASTPSSVRTWDMRPLPKLK